MEITAAGSQSQTFVSSMVTRAGARYLTGNSLLLGVAAENPDSQGAWTTNTGAGRAQSGAAVSSTKPQRAENAIVKPKQLRNKEGL